MMINGTFKLALMAAGAIQRRLSIVLFHRVLSVPDDLLIDEPDIARFAEQISWLRDRFTLLPLREAVTRLFAGELPSGALCITFDDGYRDNLLNAVPVLQDLGVRATFFVTTRFMDGGMMWNDRVAEAVRAWSHREMDLREFGLPIVSLAPGRHLAMESIVKLLKYKPFEDRDTISDALLARSGGNQERKMMDASEIRRLHDAGMEIGGHTVSHPILCSLSRLQAQREIADNKAALEAIIKEPLVSFAYPNGRPHQDYDTEHVALVRACGYRCALTTAAGAASKADSPYQLPRFTPWDRQQPKYLARMVRNYFREPERVAE